MVIEAGLQAEAGGDKIGPRFQLLMEAYLRGCGDEMDMLIRENEAVRLLKKVLHIEYQKNRYRSCLVSDYL